MNGGGPHGGPVRVRGKLHGPCSQRKILLESDKSVGKLAEGFPRIRRNLSFSGNRHFCTYSLHKVATRTICTLREQNAVGTTAFSLSDGLSFTHRAYASRCPLESAFQYPESGVSILNSRHKRATEWSERTVRPTGGPIFSGSGRGGGRGGGAYRSLHYAATMVSSGEIRRFSPSTPIRGVSA